MAGRFDQSTPSLRSNSDGEESPIINNFSSQGGDDIMASSQQSILSRFEPLPSQHESMPTITRENLKTQYFYIAYREDLPFVKIGINGTTIQQRSKDYSTAYGDCHMLHIALQMTPHEMIRLENKVKDTFKHLAFKSISASDEQEQGTRNRITLNGLTNVI